jgi:hypothetical protein
VISTDKQGLSFEQTRTNIIFGRNDVVAISKCLTLILANKNRCRYARVFEKLGNLKARPLGVAIKLAMNVANFLVRKKGPPSPYPFLTYLAY